MHTLQMKPPWCDFIINYLQCGENMYALILFGPKILGKGKKHPHSVLL